ncbi:unnamed protein product [Chironomus riparius]|uniref:Uncharacterized protein n=1 Tax=Chironomus riparius TaxID=315576 RepID=A0A9N9RY81_9DIPT|nr:unnamed protein product [Chironomus riparius]
MMILRITIHAGPITQQFSRELQQQLVVQLTMFYFYLLKISFP